MITPLHSPTTARAIFSAHELPEEVQEPVLRDLVTPRVISLSMMPTLQLEDCLELAPADALQVGDLVVFRQESFLVCHRIVGINDDLLYTKGDAASSLPEEIGPSEVVGRVTALVRKGCRHSLEPLSLDLDRSSRLERFADRSRDHIRSLIYKLVEGVARVPSLGHVVRWLVIRLTMVDVMERAPLRSLTGYTKLRTHRLSHTTELLERCASQIDPARITLIARTGPFILATCRVCPRSLQFRPSATALGVESYIRSLWGLPSINDNL